MSEPVLAARSLYRSYGSGDQVIEVLRDLDLEIREEEAVAVVGDSGVGKSTLLHILGGLDRPDAGRVEFRGRDLLGDGMIELADYRNRGVGFVFQFHHLLPEFTALENVDMPFRIGRQKVDTVERASRVLQRIGLEHRLHHRPPELSGGEQQRVAIARAVVTAPAAVLADEPTGNLDPATGAAVFDMLRELQSERGFALVLATHNERLARGCDRVLRLAQGALTPLGDTETRDYFNGVAT